MWSLFSDIDLGLWCFSSFSIFSCAVDQNYGAHHIVLHMMYICFVYLCIFGESMVRSQYHTWLNIFDLVVHIVELLFCTILTMLYRYPKVQWLLSSNFDIYSTSIDLSHKSHNASHKYPTMPHFVTEMCTFLLQNGALWDTWDGSINKLYVLSSYTYDEKMVHCGIWDWCIIGFVRQVYYHVVFSTML